MTTLMESETFWSQVCFDRDFKPEGRYQVYRELVTERMFDVLKNICPVAHGILGDERAWDLLWDYLRDEPPQCEILRELPRLIAEYLKKGLHPLLRDYPYLAELMEYEFLEVRMVFFPEDDSKPLKGRIRLNPAHALATYRWPVHFISEEFSDPEKIPNGVFHLLLWREPRELNVEFMEVNSMVAALLRQLKSEALGEKELLSRLAEENQIPLSKEFLEEGKGLLRELGEKGILLFGK